MEGGVEGGVGAVVGSRRKRRWQQGREEKGWSKAKRRRAKRVTASHGEERKEGKKGEKKAGISKAKEGDAGIKMRHGGVGRVQAENRENRGEGPKGRKVAERRSVAGRTKKDRKGRGHCGAEAADVSHLALTVHSRLHAQSPVTRMAKQLPLQLQSATEEKQLQFQKKKISNHCKSLLSNPKEKQPTGLLAPSTSSSPQAPGRRLR